MLMKMDAARWTFLLTLCLTCVPSNESCENLEYCEKFIVRPSLGSSLFLPCYIERSNTKGVIWSHTAKEQADLVKLTPEGNITFLDPRNGRVKAFPLQASEGNFSIRIDKFEEADLGCYKCGFNCLQVELDDRSTDEGIQPLIHIGARVAALLLLSVGGFYCCKKCRVLCNSKTQDTASSPTHAGTEGTEGTDGAKR